MNIASNDRYTSWFLFHAKRGVNQGSVLQGVVGFQCHAKHIEGRRGESLLATTIWCMSEPSWYRWVNWADKWVNRVDKWVSWIETGNASRWYTQIRTKMTSMIDHYKCSTDFKQRVSAVLHMTWPRVLQVVHSDNPVELSHRHNNQWYVCTPYISSSATGVVFLSFWIDIQSNPLNSYSASRDNWCTVGGDGDVGSARYELALLPPCPTIRVLSYSNW